MSTNLSSNDRRDLLRSNQAKIGIRQQHEMLEAVNINVLDSDEKPKHISIKGFDVQVTDFQDNVITLDHTFLLGYPKAQDVIDCLPYFQKSNEYYIVVNQSIRPVVGARSVLAQDETNYLQHGKFTEMMGMIFSPQDGDVSIGDTIARGVGRKLGEPNAQYDVEIMGGSYFPSIGGTCETCMLANIRIPAPEDMDSYILRGKTFDAERKVSYMKPQDIVDGYFDGTIHDMRLLYATLQFAHRHGIKLIIPTKIDGNPFTSYQNIESKILDEGKAAGRITAVKKKSRIAKVALQEKQIDSRDPQNFITHQSLQCTNTYETRSEQYVAECLVRKHIDSVDVASYFRSGGKLYMVAKLGFRPGVLARNFLPHPLHASMEPIVIEGLSAVKKEDAGSGDTYASQVVKNESGLDTTHVQYVTSYFPSCGNNPEKVDCYAAQVDPSSFVDPGQELGFFSSEVCYIEIDNLIQLGEQGIIKDPRLLLQAYLLKQYFQYQSIASGVVHKAISPQLIEKAKTILLNPLQVDGFMKNISPEAFELHLLGLQKSPWYRKLVKYIEQDLGGFMATQDMLLSETDKHFFSGMVPMFAVPSPELVAKYQNYYTHDGGHYVQGDVLPYNPETGERMDEQEYCRLMSWTESLAVYDSDYRFPMELGIDVFEKTIGGHTSVVRSFHDLGVTDPEKVREYITSIERDGIIPDAILKHEHYERNRVNIVDRLLRFHFMDHIQAKQQYQDRKDNKEFIVVALRFCNTTANAQEFINKMDTYDDMLLESGEGVNVIKAYVSRVLTKDIMLMALKFGTLKQMVVDKHGDKHPVLAQIDSIVDQLYFFKQQVIAARDTVEDTSLSEVNLLAIATADYYSSQVAGLKGVFDTFHKDTSLLDFDQIERLYDHVLPYFRGFAAMPDNLNELVQAKEKQNIERVKASY